jgi:hypothetical protein
MAQPTAVIVVNRMGHGGKCSNCNESASINDETHACGAIINRVAIEESSGVTFVDARRVTLMKRGKEFVGTGRIVSKPSGGGWMFQLEQLPGSLP